MKILITGAAGYIGSHVLLELLDRGYADTDINVIDRFLTISPNWVGGLVNHAYDGHILSIGSSEILSEKYDVIIHLGAYANGQDNLAATKRMLHFCKGAHFIFASTGEAHNPLTPFAQSKLSCEELIKEKLKDNYTIFRLYNVSGFRKGIATNHEKHLIQQAAMAARGMIPTVSIYGDDWETHDGTCVRDYIHTADVAASIVNCIEAGPANTPYEGLGSGIGHSVKEVLTSMKRVTSTDFHVIMAERRPGDVASLICPAQYSHISLTHDLDSMCLSAYEGLK